MIPETGIPPGKLFLTGASGFVGQAIARLLQSERPGESFSLVAPGQSIELRDKNNLMKALKETQPDLVIHLAAQSFVPSAFENPWETYEINFLGTLNLLEALKALGFEGRMLYVGSGDQYGLVDADDLPIVESHPLKPRNPYAVSKAAAELLCYQWSQTEGLDIMMARPFNHIGPGQDERFALSGFAKQLVEIKLGRREPSIMVGDLDVTRDFTNAADIAAAYLLLLSHGQSGEVYNVCSEKESNLGKLLELLMEISGVRAEIVRDAARFRTAEQKRVAGSNRKLRDCTGWQPTYSIEQSLKSILEDWESKLT